MRLFTRLCVLLSVQESPEMKASSQIIAGHANAWKATIGVTGSESTNAT